MVFPSSSATPFKSIAAVIPAYQPDPARFAKVLSALAPQCDKIVVVDNGGARGIAPEASARFGVALEILGEGKNMGVAAAQNLGVRRALESGAEAVLFMDQDSVAHADMVENLAGALEHLIARGCRVAGCGPRYHEPGSLRLSSFVRAGIFRLGHVLPPAGERTVACDFLISSGMLVPAETLRAVGEMEEGLFIDHVDTEWCFRAKRGGYGCHGVQAALMEHELGRNRKKIWLGRWRQVPDHTPERLYFLARNTLWLARRPYIPPACKQHLLTRFVGLAAFGVLTGNECQLRIIHLLRGIREGVH
jgi:rhamnosyltransferase